MHVKVSCGLKVYRNSLILQLSVCCIKQEEINL